MFGKRRVRLQPGRKAHAAIAPFAFACSPTPSHLQAASVLLRFSSEGREKRIKRIPRIPPHLLCHLWPTVFAPSEPHHSPSSFLNPDAYRRTKRAHKWLLQLRASGRKCVEHANLAGKSGSRTLTFCFQALCFILNCSNEP
ncbi:hypothetical protein K505DRAFT_391 [Melanomma pulvis-pyrius CBS 109.77]|uniref:Uncharacterized protein n=1 Tax=Melanomma pulvis-pyrius CBS 109.77 TaxID=1314802 RepID=A0A6A6XX93_9PLEO|nr:hypothetical protein K505DRAFT_391 [Melanomma pulvis-pyrius CBS 109.77]